MSYGPLPKRVDPRKFAEREAKIEGVADVSAMPRLNSLLADGSGEIHISLQFALDEQRLRTVSGTASGKVLQTCQRCLEPVGVDVDAEVNLAVVLNEEQAKNLPRYYDPLIVEAEDIELLSLIEDELILSLPLVSYHEDCTIQTSFGEAGEAEPEEESKPNPFSVLAALKGKADKS
ncbi:YceD family protein [Marinobacterium lutimaris]|uniref:Large ribosomal RNA subunit accumulation protein YceD n=1 Tax=Marinobacterium lutimaris TaxID=568106 RepID=A0A1H5W181_9GAMM|nr:YceD family protein [Marinobacterium lutimaris]SEF93252.1 uncharacterized protein SAMN05444390_101912 [Marinobacterium lutimaris]